MSITLSVPEKPLLQPKIMVFGVGGGGCNAVHNMVRTQLEGVEFVVANTDAQSLAQNNAARKIQIGAQKTEGLGAGSRPEVGYEAAEEAIDELADAIQDNHMIFVTAGMGGGTGTGAAPVIARLAKEMGILTVGVVTKPFQFEGARRMKLAEQGIAELQRYVDTLLVIPNQNLFRVANEQTTMTDAFAMADQVLNSAVAGITNLMTKPGLINLDFADVRSVMSQMGKAMMGTGEAEGEKRGLEAAEKAIANPLLDDVSMKGARGVLISITGNDDMKLYEVEEAANRIRSEVDPEANITVGTTTDASLNDRMRIAVVATGIDVPPATEEAAPSRRTPLTVVGGREASPFAAGAVAEERDGVRITGGHGGEPEVIIQTAGGIEAAQGGHIPGATSGLMSDLLDGGRKKKAAGQGGLKAWFSGLWSRFGKTPPAAPVMQEAPAETFAPQATGPASDEQDQLEIPAFLTHRVK